MSAPATDHFHDVLDSLNLGLCQRTVEKTATRNWNLSEQESAKLLRKAKRRLARDACRLDILGELMMSYNRQQATIDCMCRDLKKEGQPAHFFNTYRNVIRDSLQTLDKIDIQRKADNRNVFKTDEDKRAQDVENKRQSDIYFSSLEQNTRCGYFVNTTYGVCEQGIDLRPEQLAMRDFMRLRMMPKSPREDAIFADLFDAIVKDEAKEQKELQLEQINDQEVESDIRRMNPDEFSERFEGGKTSGSYKPLSAMVRRLYLERLRNYSEIWANAEQNINGIMDVFGIKPGFRHDSFGLPPLVQLAAQGDKQAIATLKEELAQHKKVKVKEEGKVKEEKVINGAGIFSTVIPLLLAFAMYWPCLMLVFGNLAPREFTGGVVARTLNVLATQPPSDLGNALPSGELVTPASPRRIVADVQQPATLSSIARNHGSRAVPPPVNSQGAKSLCFSALFRDTT